MVQNVELQKGSFLAYMSWQHLLKLVSCTSVCSSTHLMEHTINLLGQSFWGNQLFFLDIFRTPAVVAELFWELCLCWGKGESWVKLCNGSLVSANLRGAMFSSQNRQKAEIQQCFLECSGVNCHDFRENSPHQSQMANLHNFLTLTLNAKPEYKC